MKKLIGILLLACVFFGLAYLVYLREGLLVTTILFGGAFLVVCVIVAAVFLIVND